MDLFGHKLKCKVCGTGFKTQAELDAHAQTHQPQAAEVPAVSTGTQVPATQNAPQTPSVPPAKAPSAALKCEKCGATFNTTEELDAHAKTHAGQTGSQSP